jgi:uncharacterized C2H2 Zn-finger protein
MPEPLYKVMTDAWGKVTWARWFCPGCGARFHRRKSADRHTNGIAGVRGPSCPMDATNLRKAGERGLGPR